MPESIVQVTEGAGKKLHTFERTIGANTVQDEVVIPGEPYLATYTVAAILPSTATAASHLLQIMAGASLKVYLRRIQVFQLGMATAVTMCDLAILRLTTAGTGGTVQTPRPFDPADAASGATAMQLPTAKGTEGDQLWRGSMLLNQTLAASAQFAQPLVDIDFNQPRQKSPIIAAGVTNGIAVKNITAVGGATVHVLAVFGEANF